MKNRKREICTSGTVRDEGGNILIYSAAWKRGGPLAAQAQQDGRARRIGVGSDDVNASPAPSPTEDRP